MARQQPSPLSITRLEDRLTPASPELAPGPYVASGSGVGSRPLVQLYRTDGSIRSQFLAYDASFTGGVSVAMADVNADGVMDVITAAGAGGGPHVKVFDGKSLEKLFDPTQPSPAVVVELTELYSFYAYDSKFGGGVSVASGDVDGDGYADIVTGAGAGGGPHVKVFSGKTGAEIRSFFAFDANFRGGVNVAVGEIKESNVTAAIGASGQVENEFTAARRHADILVGSGAGMKATVLGFNGQTGDQFFALNPYGNFGGGVYVASGDLTGDGFDDVITGAGAGGGPHVAAYDGYTLGHLETILILEGGPQPIRSFYAYDSKFGGGARVAASDLNGDGKADIVTGAGATGGPHVKVFNGATGSELVSRFKYGLTEGTREFTAGVTVGAAYKTPVTPPTA